MEGTSRQPGKRRRLTSHPRLWWWKRGEKRGNTAQKRGQTQMDRHRRATPQPQPPLHRLRRRRRRLRFHREQFAWYACGLKKKKRENRAILSTESVSRARSGQEPEGAASLWFVRPIFLSLPLWGRWVRVGRGVSICLCLLLWSTRNGMISLGRADISSISFSLRFLPLSFITHDLFFPSSLLFVHAIDRSIVFIHLFSLLLIKALHL